MKIKKISKINKTEFMQLESLVFPDDEITSDDFDHLIKNEGFIGMFEDETLIGYLILNLYDTYGRLNRIAIHPEFQRKGIGSKLMEYTLNYFKNHSAKEIILYVSSTNTPAINLYYKYGFEKEVESWHYIIDFNKFVNESPISTDKLQIEDVKTSDIDTIVSIFPNVERKELKVWIDKQSENKESSLRFLLGHYNDKPVIFVRFSPSYSGCKPFEFANIKCVDPFIEILRDNYIRDKSFIRLEFDDYPELADKFDKTGYRLHHHLYKMKLVLLK